MDDNTQESQLFSQPCQRLQFDIEMDNQQANQQVDNHEARQVVQVHTNEEDDEDLEVGMEFSSDEEVDEEPVVGMEFSSDERAYKFYTRYARKMGFSSRKNLIKKSNHNVIITRQFCCSKEGRKREKKNIAKRKSTRPNTRTQCQASMIIKLQMNGRYKVTKFMAEHNHEVVTPSKVHMLRSQKGFTDDKEIEEEIVESSGISPKATLEYFSRQSGGRENIGFMPIDYKNYLQRKRKSSFTKKQRSIGEMDDNTRESQPFSQPCRKLQLDIEIDDQQANQQVDNHEARQVVQVQTNEEVDEDQEVGMEFSSDEVDEEPEVGMEFSSDESAYKFYNRYARKMGFSTRKNWTKKSNDNVIIKRQFCCSKEGQKRERKNIVERKSTRPNTRTQCQASMIIKLQMNGRYKVTKFMAEHNHGVVTSSKVHMLRSQRGFTDDKKIEVGIVEASGMSPKATLEYFSRQSGGQENIGFMPIDYKNYLRRKRMKVMKRGDAGAVLRYFQKMQVNDPSFYYAIQVDEDDLITNMFWVDGKSIIDYSVFGDVICFDTTYRINSYGRPFAPFIGVNHHKQTVIFGAALLYDETIESFKWLFETFLSAMSGRQPTTILTDQDAAIANAIAIVMPETHHRLCIWHIYQHATKHLDNVFKGSKSFEHDFSRCVYDYEEEEEFLTAWNKMLKKYDLMQNKWLQNLFQEREKWALVYGRNTFCADMKSTQRRKNMNNLWKRYLNSKYNLLHFFNHYERVLAHRRYKEVVADFRMRQSTLVLVLDMKMLKEAANTYTPKVFEIFQNEFKKILGHSLFKCGEVGTVAEFRVTDNDKVEGRTVKFDSLDNKVTCSCHKFEFMGILCSHALKVLDYYNIKVLPPCYIMKRWHRDAKVGFTREAAGLTIQGNCNIASGKRYRYMSRKLLKIAAMVGEHEEVFKFADRYSDNFHDEVIECMKRIKELPLKSYQAVDESIDPEGAFSDPTESVDTETESARFEPIENVNTENACSKAHQFTFTPMSHFNQSSQSMVVSTLVLPGRSIDASLPQSGYQLANLNVLQQNLFKLGSDPSGSTSDPLAACGYPTINLYHQLLSSNPQLSSQESVVCNQSPPQQSDKN